MATGGLIRGLEVMVFPENVCNIRKGPTLIDIQSLNQRPELLPFIRRQLLSQSSNWQVLSGFFDIPRC